MTTPNERRQQGAKQPAHGDDAARRMAPPRAPRSPASRLRVFPALLLLAASSLLLLALSATALRRSSAADAAAARCQGQPLVFTLATTAKRARNGQFAAALESLVRQSACEHPVR